MNGENIAVRCETEDVAEIELKSLTNSIEKILVGLRGHSGPEIPLWDKEQTLTWDFNEESIQDFLIENKYFNNVEDVKNHVRRLIQSSISLWGDSMPVKFLEKEDGVPSFNIILTPYNDCKEDDIGNKSCVLASAFFPNTPKGKRNLAIYPYLFERNLIKQIETIAHEFGHVYGLRHWFAKIRDTEMNIPSEIFGHHDRNNPDSIMNYNEYCRMTFYDIRDVQKLYSLAWEGQLKTINGVPIKFYKS